MAGSVSTTGVARPDGSGGLRTRLIDLPAKLPWYAIAPAALMLFLGFRGIASVGYWVDEFYTLNAVRGGLGETLGEIPYLPYYAVVWFGSGGGGCLTETCLRYPSALAMAVAVVATAFAARVMTNRWGGLAAGLMLTLAPSAQRYAIEARPYAFGLALVCLASMFLVLGTHRRSHWPWLGYSITIAAAGLVVPIALASLAGHALLVCRRPVWSTYGRRWLASLILVVPVLSLQAWWMLGGSTGRSASEDPFVVHPQNFVQALSWPFATTTQIGAGEAAFAAVLVVLASWSRPGTRWLLAYLVSGTAVWISSFGPATWWQARTLVPLAGLLVIGAAVTLAQYRGTRFIGILVLLGLLSSTTYSAIRLPWSRGYDYRQAAQIVDSQWVAGDRIDPGAQLPWVVQWSLDHYTADGAQFVDETDSSSGRTWVFGGSPNCSEAERWDLGLGSALILCEGTPVSALPR